MYYSGSDDDDIKFGSDEDNDMKGGDFGLNILAGYQLKNGFNIGLNYGLGFSAWFRVMILIIPRKTGCLRLR